MALFSRNQHFSHPLLGSLALNAVGMHLLRLFMATVCFRWRQLIHRNQAHRDALLQLRRDGYLLLPDFLPKADFIQLQQEIRQRMIKVDSLFPMQSSHERGFGEKHFFTNGFDRFDGGTLNRFYDITLDDTALQQLCKSNRLQSLLSALAGMRMKPQQLSLYKVKHSANQHNPDIQKDWHRDTFQPALKMWYFTEEVTAAHGPFEYIPGSHRMTRARLAWEYRQSVHAAKHKAGGSFRIAEQQACELTGFAAKQFCVPANTLVVADIRGFHRRGMAQPGAERVSLYANLRPHPFKLW